MAVEQFPDCILDLRSVFHVARIKQFNRDEEVEKVKPVQDFQINNPRAVRESGELLVSDLPAMSGLPKPRVLALLLWSCSRAPTLAPTTLLTTLGCQSTTFGFPGQEQKQNITPAVAPRYPQVRR